LTDERRPAVAPKRVSLEPGNGVLWPTKLSPRLPAAVLRIPKQKFDSPEQLEFAKVLSYESLALHPGAPAAGKPEPG
jgi:hypothetical protein